MLLYADELEWRPRKDGDRNKVIVALELLVTLVAVQLWVPEGEAKKTRGWPSVATPTTSGTRRY